MNIFNQTWPGTLSSIIQFILRKPLQWSITRWGLLYSFQFLVTTNPHFKRGQNFQIHQKQPHFSHKIFLKAIFQRMIGLFPDFVCTILLTLWNWALRQELRLWIWKQAYLKSLKMKQTLFDLFSGLWRLYQRQRTLKRIS